MAGETMIAIRDLAKSFGAIRAVDGVSFTVGRGEVLGFLGPNGAGKSTTMKMVAGFLIPSAGSASVCGFDVERQPLAAKRQLGYLPEGAPAYPDMTPRGFLNFAAKIRGLSGKAKRVAVERAVERANLHQVLLQPIDTLSKGFKRRVGLAQALLHDPPVLVLDEPTDGLDPNQKHEVRKLIQSLAAEKAIVISTHILEEVEAICSRAVIIARGRIVADGTPAELAKRDPLDGAVLMTVPLATWQTAARRLQQQPGVGILKARQIGPDLVEISMIPAEANRPNLMQEIAAVARAEPWGAQRLWQHHGKLDAYFREVTTAPPPPSSDIAA